MNPTFQTTFSLENQSPKEQEFWNLLVFAVTGYNLCDLPPSKKSQILNDSRTFLLEYIAQIINLKYSSQESQRITNAISHNLFAQKHEIKEIITSFFNLLQFELTQQNLPELKR